jgi:outer membrane protein OmpA-like peptidoglycan-associated protein
MKTPRLALCVIGLGLLALDPAAFAGDPVAVNEVLGSIKNNWSDAQFSVDVSGLSEDEAVTDQALQAEFEAAHPGYLALLLVSSHGEMRLVKGDGAQPSVSGVLPISVQPPLGREHIIFLFSDRRLDEALGDGNTPLSLGADRAHADAFVRKLQALQDHGLLLVARRVDYLVNAPAGQTQYTTRSIFRAVEEGHMTLPTRIEFEFDSDRLTAQSRLELDSFGEALVSQFHDRKVVLEGHTDALGTEEYNLSLSDRRARAARQYLMENFGLSAAQLDAAGRGKAGAIAPNDTEANMSKNRRVDFIFQAEEPSASAKR